MPLRRESLAFCAARNVFLLLAPKSQAPRCIMCSKNSFFSGWLLRWSQHYHNDVRVPAVIITAVTPCTFFCYQCVFAPPEGLCLCYLQDPPVNREEYHIQGVYDTKRKVRAVCEHARVAFVLRNTQFSTRFVRHTVPQLQACGLVIGTLTTSCSCMRHVERIKLGTDSTMNHFVDTLD